MEAGEVSVLIGGKAGEGISSAGQVIARLLGQLGYRVHMYFDYPSLIKGGHNFAIVRGAGRQIGAVRSRVDLILALDQETLAVHEGRLSEDGVVVYNRDTARHPPGIGIPVKAILAAGQAPAVMGNSAILGAFIRSAGIDWPFAEKVFTRAFRKGTAQNLRIARAGYDASEERLRIPPLGKPPLPAFTGNEAMGIGLVEAGTGVYLSYPMSPTSNLMHFLAARAGDGGAGVRVVQPESEIAVILMALGCSYAGTRAAVGTSGGGFSLMVEALGLAGMAELPALIVLGQRAGPSTGLATYTAQADLEFAIHAGHGEFPRLVIAPGDADEARTWIRAGMDLAWKYQLPAIFLPDRILCEGMYSLDPAATLEYQAGPVLADPGALHQRGPSPPGRSRLPPEGPLPPWTAPPPPEPSLPPGPGIPLQRGPIPPGRSRLPPEGPLPPWTAPPPPEPSLPPGPGAHPYLRYALTGTGISPLRFPPAKGELVRVNSHVHDPDGTTTEDPGMTRAMAEKRQRKMAGLARELEGMRPVNVLGDPDARTAVLCWGSNKGICGELGAKLGLRVVQPVALWPFPEESFAKAMDGVDRFYGVETNETGQLARLVRGYGYRASGMVLKYDGRPFMVDELEQELRRVMA